MAGTIPRLTEISALTSGGHRHLEAHRQESRPTDFVAAWAAHRHRYLSYLPRPDFEGVFAGAEWVCLCLQKAAYFAAWLTATLCVRIPTSSGRIDPLVEERS